MDYEASGKQVKVAVIMYEDGEVFEVASNEQYPDGVYMLLQLAAQAIINETLVYPDVQDDTPSLASVKLCHFRFGNV